MINKLNSKILFLLVFGLLTFSASTFDEEEEAPKGLVKWLNIEEALQLFQDDPKRIVVNISTDWCLPCKQMEASTFSDPSLAKYLNEYFYAVKFNAESEESVTIRGNTYEYNNRFGRNGVHGLAIHLSNGELLYPTIAILDEYLGNPNNLSGFQNVDDLTLFLDYFGKDYHKKVEWDVFLETYGKNHVTK